MSLKLQGKSPIWFYLNVYIKVDKAQMDFNLVVVYFRDDLIDKEKVHFMKVVYSKDSELI